MHSDGFEILRTLAEANERLSAFERELRCCNCVTKVVGGLDVRRYVDCHSIERWIEADLATGENVCWWLEINFDGPDEYTVETRVYVSHGDNIRIFPDSSAKSISQLIGALNEAVTNLVQTILSAPVRELVGESKPKSNGTTSG